MGENRPQRRRPLPQDPKRIFRKRWESGLTQLQLAEKAQISAQQMSAIESGTKGASVDSLHRLSDALGCDVSELMPAETAASS